MPVMGDNACHAILPVEPDAWNAAYGKRELIRIWDDFFGEFEIKAVPAECIAQQIQTGIGAVVVY